MLKPLNHICNYNRYTTEDEHADAVFGPSHLVVFIDPGEAVEKPFDGTKDRISEGALTFEDPGHVQSQGPCAEEDKQEENADLKPAVSGHRRGSLELFRAQQCVYEVNEQGSKNNGEQSEFKHQRVSFGFFGLLGLFGPRPSHPAI